MSEKERKQYEKDMADKNEYEQNLLYVLQLLLTERVGRREVLDLGFRECFYEKEVFGIFCGLLSNYVKRKEEAIKNFEGEMKEGLKKSGWFWVEIDRDEQ